MARRPEPRWYESRGGWYAWIDGKQIRLAAGKEAKDEAYRRFHRLMLEREQGPVATMEPITIHVLADMVLDWTKTNREPSTSDWYVRHLTHFCRKFGKMKAKDLRPEHVARWLATKTTWSQSTQHGMITAIRRIYRWGLRHRFLAEDPTLSLERPGVESRRLVISAEQVAKILRNVDGPFRDLIFILNETGMRPSEAYRLEAADVDWDRSHVVFARHKTRRKTKRPRIVHLTPAALSLLEKLAESRPTGPLLRNGAGGPWNPHVVGHRFGRLRKSLRMGPEATAIAIRHLFITDGLDKGVPIATLAELAGHQSTKMIEQHYGHLGDRGDHMAAAARKIRPHKPVKGSSDA